MLSLGSNKKRWRQDLDRSHPLLSTRQPPALQQTSTTVLGQTEPSSHWGRRTKGTKPAATNLRLDNKRIKRGREKVLSSRPPVAEVRPLGLECDQRPDRQAEGGGHGRAGRVGGGGRGGRCGGRHGGLQAGGTRPTDRTEADQSLLSLRRPNRCRETRGMELCLALVPSELQSRTG